MNGYFVADIGGTNARFGCVAEADSFRQISRRMTFRNADFADVEALIKAYLESLTHNKINGGCLAIAGPVLAEQVCLTNRGWAFDSTALRQRLGMKQLAVINDFVSLAHSLPHLTPADLSEIVPGKPAANATRIVLGPGTGLGMAALISEADGKQTVISTEAGHVGFAPGSELEIEVLGALRRECGHVPIEDLVSGSGLPRLHAALAQVRGAAAQPLSATEITAHAAAHKDSIQAEVVVLFCTMLAGFAGDMALCFHAHGGVYLGGGLLPKLAPTVIAENFAGRFRNKGRMAHVLADTPVYLIKPSHAALIGASSYYQSMQTA